MLKIDSGNPRYSLPLACWNVYMRINYQDSVNCNARNFIEANRQQMVSWLKSYNSRLAEAKKQTNGGLHTAQQYHPVGQAMPG